jgi:hypothetical protein
MKSLKDKIEIIQAELTFILALSKYCESHQNAESERNELERLLEKYDRMLNPPVDEWRLDQ